MSKQDDGGPAFPCATWDDHDGGSVELKHPGMSLRVWIATKLAQGMLASLTNTSNWPEGEYADALVAKAYQLADAMLRARAVDGGGR